MIVDIKLIATPLRRYVELAWRDVDAFNRIDRLESRDEPPIAARYWTSVVGYFDETEELKRRLDRALVRVIEKKNLPQLEDEQWRTLNNVRA